MGKPSVAFSFIITNSDKGVVFFTSPSVAVFIFSLRRSDDNVYPNKRIWFPGL